MAVSISHKKKVVDSISCVRGTTSLFYSGIVVEYRPKAWLLRLNPKFVLPGCRKEHRKNIYINGRKRGYAESRQGYIPLPFKKRPVTGLGPKLGNIFRSLTGLGCRLHEKGYFRFILGPYKYTVIRRISENGLLISEVYETGTNNLIGYIIFNQELSEVHTRTGMEGVNATLCVIAGYIADIAVYTRAAAQLNQTIKIKI